MPDALLEVVVGIDPLRDQTEIERLAGAALDRSTRSKRCSPTEPEAG
jgi:hypothetical protein